jgi:hypothetical protein
MKISTPHFCTIWRKGAPGLDGIPTLGAPEEFKSHWTDRQQKFQEHAGDERISTSIIYVQDPDLVNIGDHVARGSRNEMIRRNLTTPELTTIAGSLNLTLAELVSALLLVDAIPGLNYAGIMKKDWLSVRIVRAKNDQGSVNGKDRLIKLYCQ